MESSRDVVFGGRSGFILFYFLHAPRHLAYEGANLKYRFLSRGTYPWGEGWRGGGAGGFSPLLHSTTPPNPNKYLERKLSQFILCVEPY